MNNISCSKFSYNGYYGSAELSVEDNCLHGRILFIDDLITYEGATVEELSASFKGAVAHYIAHCKETGRPANKPYSGTFNVRIGKDLHRKAAQEANKRNISLNDYVAQAVKSATEQSEAMKVEHTHRHFIIPGNLKPETKVATMDELSAWEPINATAQ